MTDKRDATTGLTIQGRTWNGSAAIAQAELDLERSRQHVAQSVMALRRHVEMQMAWREWMRERPTLLVFVGLTVGLYVGYRTASWHL